MDIGKAVTDIKGKYPAYSSNIDRPLADATLEGSNITSKIAGIPAGDSFTLRKTMEGTEIGKPSGGMPPGCFCMPRFLLARPAKSGDATKTASVGDAPAEIPLNRKKRFNYKLPFGPPAIAS